MNHDSLEAEYVAAYWHKLGLIFSLAAVASGVGIAFFAGVGAYWHHWAEGQHHKRIAAMKGIRPYSSNG